MAKELPYVLTTGDKSFNVMWDENGCDDCSFCGQEKADGTTTLMMSSEMYPHPVPDLPMLIGFSCWEKYIYYNPMYIIYNSLIPLIGKDISNLVVIYMN